MLSQKSGSIATSGGSMYAVFKFRRLIYQRFFSADEADIVEEAPPIKSI
jgi:hypothetical protein